MPPTVTESRGSSGRGRTCQLLTGVGVLVGCATALLCRDVATSLCPRKRRGPRPGANAGKSPLSGLTSLPIVATTSLRGFPRRASLPWQAPAKVHDHCVAPDEAQAKLRLKPTIAIGASAVGGHLA